MTTLKAKAAEYTALDQVIPIGVTCIETDTGRRKTGTGGLRWKDLPYNQHHVYVDPDSGQVAVDGAPVPSSAVPGSVAGPYPDVATLQGAKPAAANPGMTALVGSAAPYAQYASNGAAWAPIGASAASASALPRVDYHYETLAALQAAVAVEQAAVAAGSPRWVDGTRLNFGTAPNTASLIWNATAANARLISFGSGKTLALLSDTASITFASGAPAAAFGANGDVSIDWNTGAYLKAAGAWTLALQIAAVSGAGIALAAVSQRLLPRDLFFNFPVLSALSPTLTMSAANVASSITSGIAVDSATPGAMGLQGAPYARIAGYPFGSFASLGRYLGPTSGTVGSATFLFDTTDTNGRLELVLRAASGVPTIMLWQNGRWEYINAPGAYTLPVSGDTYRLLITFGSPGSRIIRLESVDSVPCLTLPPGSGVSPVYTSSRRLIVVGDSFTEPTIVDTAAAKPWQGFPRMLGYATGLDVWAAGSGSTGYTTAGVGNGRVKFRDRLLQDVVPYLRPGDGVLFAGGINDPVTDVASLAAFQQEVDACQALIASNTTGVKQALLGPFSTREIATGFNSWQVAKSDAVRASALAAGSIFIDINFMGDVGPGFANWSSVTSSAAVAGATTITVASLPAYAFTTQEWAANDWYVAVGSGQNKQVRKVTGTVQANGSPYSLNLQIGLGTAMPVGSPVAVIGGSWVTGAGQVGNPAGGSADIYRSASPDGTHPTISGHRAIAIAIATELQRVGF